MAKDRMFSQMSALPFTGSADNKEKENKLILPYSENVKDNPTPTSKTTLPYSENIPQDNNVKPNIEFATVPYPKGVMGVDYNNSTWRKVEWGGLNLRDTTNSGELSYAKNMSTDEYPYLTPRKARVPVLTQFYNGEDSEGNPIIIEPRGLFSMETEKLDAIMWVGRKADNSGEALFFVRNMGSEMRTYNLGSGFFGSIDYYTRNMVKFGEYISIYPDAKQLDIAYLPSNNTTLPSLSSSAKKIKYACAYPGLGRIFGVSDKDSDGNAASCICATRYGRHDLWSSFSQGQESSWEAKVLSDKNFTGITLYKNHILAFKENMTHEQYGINLPYRIQDIFNVGTVDHHSIQIVNNRLLFCSKQGVYSYTGGREELISFNLNLNNVTGLRARAGTDGRKYYLSVYNNGEWNLFVYDTWFNLWTKEDNLHVVAFTYYRRYLYGLTAEGQLLNMASPTGYSDDWEAITDYYADDILERYVKEIRLRFDIAEGSTMSISIQYDDGEFEHIETYDNTDNKYSGMQTIKCSIIPKSAYRYRIKFKGSGYVKIYAMQVLMAGE